MQVFVVPFVDIPLIFFKVVIAEFWNYNTTYEQREQIYASTTSSMTALRALTPSSGAYQVSTCCEI